MSKVPANATRAERRIRVDEMTRVEGEGSLTLAVKDGKVGLADGGAAKLAAILDGVRPHFRA